MKFKSIQDLKFFFPTSRTPINHNFQSAGRKIPELDIITDQLQNNNIQSFETITYAYK